MADDEQLLLNVSDVDEAVVVEQANQQWGSRLRKATAASFAVFAVTGTAAYLNRPDQQVFRGAQVQGLRGAQTVSLWGFSGVVDSMSSAVTDAQTAASDAVADAQTA